MKTYNMIAKTLFALTCVCCSVRGSENGIQQKKSSFSSSKNSSSSSSSIHRISSGPEKELARKKSNRYADGAETNETTETAETTEPAITTVTTEPAMTTVTIETTMTTDDNSANENEQGNIKEDIKAIKKAIKALMEDSEESGSHQNINQLIFSPVTSKGGASNDEDEGPVQEPSRLMARNGNADGAETTETAEATEPAMTTVTTEPAMTTVTTETTMTTDDNSANENEQGNIKEEIKAIKEDIKALMEDREGSKSEASGSEESGSKQNTNQLIFSPVTKYIEALGKAIRKDVRAFMEDRKGKNARRMEMTRRKESKSEARGQESGRKKQNIDKVTRKSNGSAKEWSSNAGSINEGKKETRQSTKFQKFSSKRRMVTKQTSAKSP